MTDLRLPELSPEARFLQIEAPAMIIAESNDQKSVGFLFRAPTCGWIACGIPVAQALAMGRHLVETVASRMSPPAVTNH